MRKKILKTIGLNAVAFGTTACNIGGYYPVAVGLYAAIWAGGFVKWPTIFVMCIGLYYFAGAMEAAKVTMVLAAISILMYISKDKLLRKNQMMGAVTSATLYGIMEMSEITMTAKADANYNILALAALMTFSGSLVFSRILENLLLSEKYISRAGKQIYDEKDRETGQIQEKVKMMASSFDRMSKSIACINVKHDETDCLAVGEAVLSNVDIVNEIWKNRMAESRNAIAMQLKEMAGILKELGNTTYTFAKEEVKKEECIKAKLKAAGITVKNIVMLTNKRGINEINITLKADRKTSICISHVNDIISSVYKKKYKACKDKTIFINRDFATYTFIEEPNFFMLYGIAKRGKDEDEVSGDNFSVISLKSGQTIISLSDGMGHGLKAYKESEMVLSLLEELMESGFSEETSLRLINTIFMVENEDINPASVDMGVIDMYSGVCDFMKIGAATTFIKRDGWVEAIKSKSMPIGATVNLDMETTVKKLYDGDFIIMMSDGVNDSIESDDKEKYISDILMRIDSKNPAEFANRFMTEVISDSDFKKKDDMLVVVAGIWNK